MCASGFYHIIPKSRLAILFRDFDQDKRQQSLNFLLICRELVACITRYFRTSQLRERVSVE